MRRSQFYIHSRSPGWPHLEIARAARRPLERLRLRAAPGRPAAARKRGRAPRQHRVPHAAARLCVGMHQKLVAASRLRAGAPSRDASFPRSFRRLTAPFVTPGNGQRLTFWAVAAGRGNLDVLARLTFETPETPETLFSRRGRARAAVRAGPLSRLCRLSVVYVI